MHKTQIIEMMGRERVVGILRTDTAEQAILASRAMVEAGMACIEITWTVPGAAVALTQLLQEFPDVLWGAGSITTPDRCRQALAAGAEFIVAPNFDARVVGMTLEAGKVSCPGVVTPTEMVNAHHAGADVLKIFPINCLGGVAYLKAVRGPLPEYRFCPTGGVDKDTLKSYLDAGAFCTGAGGNLVPMKDVRAGNYAAVVKNTREFIAARDAAVGR